MRRPLAMLLAFALSLASWPAQAQLRAAPALARAVPSIALPRLAPAALSPVSLTPAHPSGIAAPPLAPAPSAAHAAAPLARLEPRQTLAAPPASARAASPLPLSPARIAALDAGPANDNHAPAAGETLSALAAPGAAPAAASLAFDGGRLLAAGDGPSLTPAPGPGRGPAPLQRTSLYRRIVKKKVPTAYRAFTDGLAYGALLGGVGLAWWGVTSWVHAPAISVVAGLAVAGVLAAVDVARLGGRVVRRIAKRPAPAPVAASRPTRWAVRLMGAALGLSIAVGAFHYERPLVERYHAWADAKLEAAQRENVRQIPGGAFSRETRSVLSQNAVGRSILDQLRDRGGVVRLPHFYVVTEDSVLAQYNSVTDAVYIERGQITALGYTVEQFLADPAVQAKVVAELQSTIAHELTHTAQARRSPLEKEYWLPAMQHEYEAFVNELWYNHERLKADPRAPIMANDLQAYEESLADLAGYLRGLDGLGSYKDNVQVDNARWRAWRAGLEARWPAHRVEGYLLLAERAQAQGRQASAQRYWNQAREASEAAGLPAPAPLGKR